MFIVRNLGMVICRFVMIFLVLVTLPAGPAAAGDKMDLGKAIRIGTGKTMVIEFTDPDCPFCRKAAAYFSNRRDVTLYIFLKPLAMHPHAREKAEYILSAADRAKAYEEVMAGRLDGKRPAGVTPAGERLLDEHMAIARDEKIDSVPIFVIAGRIVTGFNEQKIEALLPR
jgi:thiol:disulfide interchange protein DsbC